MSDDNTDASVPRPPGNPNWHKGMKSPWPAGRPPGQNKQTKLMQRMLEDADGIVDALIAKALEGDTGAAGLIMSRVLPALKSQTEKVQFDFDPSLPVSRQIEQVLAAIASGAVSADVAKQIIDAVGTLSAVRAVEDLEMRIITLEERAA